MTEQLFLVKVSKMMVGLDNEGDECEIVLTASLVLTRPQFDAISISAYPELLDASLSDIVKGLRPMTREEIRKYRDNEDGE